MVCSLPIELVDVVLVVDERQTQQHGAVILDGVLAQLAGLELIAWLSLDLALCDGIQGVHGEVTQIAGIPQRELRCGAAFHILTHLIGRAKAGDEHLADQVRILHGAR